MNRYILIAVNTVRSFATPAFNFLITIFGIKFFGKEDWGTLINALLWTFFMVFSFGWGNREYLIRKYSKQPRTIYHSFYSNFFSRSILLPLALLLLLFFPFPIAIWCIALVVLMHVYNALDSLVVYHQKFGAQLIAECIAFSIIIASVFYSNTFNLVTFLSIYAFAYLCKLIFLFMAMQLWKEECTFQISLKEFKGGFSFFLLGFSGWLMSKIDIYVVDFFLPKAKLSEYQLLITSFLMLQALAGFLMIPFTKHVYRLNDSVIKKLKIKLYSIAVPVVTIGCLAIWFVMEKFVVLNLDSKYYILGVFIALPAFFYTINVMQLLKKHQEHKVIYINCIGTAINLILILILIEDQDIYGVLLSVCITQWLVLLIYKLAFNTST